MSFNVQTQYLPDKAIFAIRGCRSSKVELFNLSKGFSEPLYFLHYNDPNDEIIEVFEIICYGDFLVSNIVKEIKESEVIEFQHENSLKKLNFLISFCIQNFNIDSKKRILVVEGKKVTDTENFDILTLF